MKMEKEKNVRFLALRSLLAIEKDRRYSNLEVDASLCRSELSPLDRALYTALVYAAVERKITLDYLISLFSSRDRIEREVRMILRLGLVQLFFLDKIPPHAAVDESVSLCRLVGKGSAASFVNAVLRSALREKEKIVYPTEKKENLSVRFSVSPDVASLFLGQFGFDRAEKLFEAMNGHPYPTLRVNTLRTTPESLAAKVGGEVVGHAVRLLSPKPLSGLDCLGNGEAFVQDLSSGESVEIFDPRPGERILDACACPGGKSFAAAILMKNEGKIVSCDLHANKLSLVSRGAALLGLSCIEPTEADASFFHPDWENAFDRVLCDVPCSGLGVLAKKPDIRYKEEKDFVRLPAIQGAILQNCARYVRSGGFLQYSTCTLNRKENEEVTSRFLSEEKAFEKIEEKTFFPDTDFSDGFYLCKMKKK